MSWQYRQPEGPLHARETWQEAGKPKLGSAALPLLGLWTSAGEQEDRSGCGRAGLQLGGLLRAREDWEVTR
jgi:hypothetical protein